MYAGLSKHGQDSTDTSPTLLVDHLDIITAVIRTIETFLRKYAYCRLGRNPNRVGANTCRERDQCSMQPGLALCTVHVVMCRVGSGSDTWGRAGLWGARVKQTVKPGLYKGLRLGSGQAGLKPGLTGGG